MLGRVNSADSAVSMGCSRGGAAYKRQWVQYTKDNGAAHEGHCGQYPRDSVAVHKRQGWRYMWGIVGRIRWGMGAVHEGHCGQYTRDNVGRT